MPISRLIHSHRVACASYSANYDSSVVSGEKTVLTRFLYSHVLGARSALSHQQRRIFERFVHDYANEPVVSHERSRTISREATGLNGIFAPRIHGGERFSEASKIATIPASIEISNF